MDSKRNYIDFNSNQPKTKLSSNILIQDDHDDELIQQIIEEYEFKDENESDNQIKIKENILSSNSKGSWK